MSLFLFGFELDLVKLMPALGGAGLLNAPLVPALSLYFRRLDQAVAKYPIEDIRRGTHGDR